MSKDPKLKLAAIQIGDLLKWDTSLNEIERIASGVFPFTRESFPSEGITSSRARLIYEWLMTLFKQRIPDSKKTDLLKIFLNTLTPEDLKSGVQDILDQCGIPVKLTIHSIDEQLYDARKFHPTVVHHSKELFLKGQYFHAVFEAVKAFNQAVKHKSGLDKDGQALMHEVFSSSKPRLKITPCMTTTDRNIQDGYRFLAAGLMSAIRNPLAHEPAATLPVEREDALDILSLISYLFKWLDRAIVEQH